MRDLSHVLEKGWPGSTRDVKRWDEATPGYPDAIWTNAALMQQALDRCVTWAPGVTPPTAAAVLATVASYDSWRSKQNALGAWMSKMTFSDGLMDARAVEELIDYLVTATAISQTVKDRLAERKTLRAQKPW